MAYALFANSTRYKDATIARYVPLFRTYSVFKRQIGETNSDLFRLFAGTPSKDVAYFGINDMISFFFILFHPISHGSGKAGNIISFLR